MELDDFKRDWAGLESESRPSVPSRAAVRAGDGLDPLRRGQWLQLLAGLAGCGWIAPIWVAQRGQPAMLLAGLCLHVYCVGLIALAVALLWRIHRIDPAAPVLVQQRRLLRLRRAYLLGVLLLGLSWWWLYVPLLIVWSGGALWTYSPGVVVLLLLVGVLGSLLSWAVYRWAGRSGRERLRGWLDAIVLGAGIRRAEQALAELARFERD